MHKVLKLGIAAAFESFGHVGFSIGASPQKLAGSTPRAVADAILSTGVILRWQRAW